MSTTANEICTGALELVGAIDPEDTPGSAMLASAYRRLQNMIRAWSIQSLTIPTIGREVFTALSGKGSTTNPYTVGPGGDLNTTRPAQLEGVGLVLAPVGTAPAVEISRAQLTDTMYQFLTIKDLPNQLFTIAYYNATFAGGLGTLYLWPVPNTSVNQIALYRLQQLATFSSPTAAYDLPEGAEEAVEYNLARRLLDTYAVDVTRKMNILDLAKSSLAIYKRSNTRFTDQPIDPMFTPDNRGGGYDINTGDNRGFNH